MANAVVNREAWLQARTELLAKEKAHTRERFALAQERAQLPWVLVEKDYRFHAVDGERTFSDLFGASSQLVIYHLMLGPGWNAPCVGCAQWADAMSGNTSKFADADARCIAVSRAPIDEIEHHRQQRGWNFAWYSSNGSDFNLDYHVSTDDLGDSVTKQVGVETLGFDRGENHGISVFVKDEDAIYHTYSVYNRGVEAMNGAFGYYDLLPKGRPW